MRHLGVPLGVGITHKQAFDWVKLKGSQKIKQWQWTLLPMEGRIKVINSILTPYVLYSLPLMKLSTTNWKEILSPIKSFLWKTIVGEKRSFYWGKWKDAAKPKEWGGLGIINPIIQCKAICAKFLTKMVIRE